MIICGLVDAFVFSFAVSWLQNCLIQYEAEVSPRLRLVADMTIENPMSKCNRFQAEGAFIDEKHER